MTSFRRITILFIVIALSAMRHGQVFGDESTDSATAWKGWKDISTAVALRDLDGPDDIIEKAEIIDDRVDELKREKVRLKQRAEEFKKKLEIISDQRDTLRDLAETQRGGDPQTRRHIQDQTERIREIKKTLKTLSEMIPELEKELTRMKNLASAYREKARVLRLQEGGAP